MESGGCPFCSNLARYKATVKPFSGSVDPRSAGNGSLMRLAPVPMLYFPDCERAAEFSAQSSRTTHGAAECLDACRLFGHLLCTAWRELSARPSCSAQIRT